MRKLFIFLFSLPLFCAAQTTHVINPSSGGGNGGSSLPDNVVYLSKSGIVSDANINLYDSSFGTDQTDAIQTILNTASAANPLNLVWDVKISCSGLKIKSHTTIIALPGCGAILRDSVDNWLLSNYNWTANSNAIADSFITINGGTWNANGWRRGLQKQANNTHEKGQITLINFWGTKNVILKNATFLNASTYCLAFMTSKNIYIDNCIINDGVGNYNQDGIDFVGYAENINITNCSISNGDDKIAFIPNATGGTYTAGNGIVADHSVYTGVDGDQSNINIHNIKFFGYGKGFAFYLQGGNKISDVYISNISGTCQSTWFDMTNYLTGYTITSGTQIAHNFHISNVDVQVASYVGYGANPRANMLIQASIDRLDLKNITRSNWSQNAETINISTPTGSPRAVTIGNLTIDGYQSLRSGASGNVASHIILGNATINTFNLINSTIDFYDYANSINRALLETSSSTVINNLFMSNDRVNNFDNVVINAGTIGKLLVNGLIHTGADLTNEPAFLNTGTISNSAFSNIICKQLTSGTFANSDSTNIVYY